MSDIRLFSRTAVALLATAGLAACGDSTAPAGAPPVSLSFAAKSTAPVFSRQSSGARPDIVITVGSGSLTITRAQLVFRDVKLEGIATTSCVGDDDGPDGDVSSSSKAGDDDCNEVKLGPMLVDLPLSGAPETAATIGLPQGSYREIKLKVHAPESGSSRDVGFLAANPSFAGVSVRVEGTYNGQPFVYTSNVEAEAEMEFSTPFVVAGGTNLTIAVNLNGWFRDSSGNLIDPATAASGGANEATVENNIKASFDAYRDDNRDGNDDDSPGSVS